MWGGLNKGIIFSEFSDPSHFIWSSDKTILGISGHQDRLIISHITSILCSFSACCVQERPRRWEVQRMASLLWEAQLRLQICMPYPIIKTKAASQNKPHRPTRLWRNLVMICCSLSKSPWRSHNLHSLPDKSVLAHLFLLSSSTPVALASFLFLKCLWSLCLLAFVFLFPLCGLFSPIAPLPCKNSAPSHLNRKLFPLHPVQNAPPITLPF